MPCFSRYANFRRHEAPIVFAARPARSLRPLILDEPFNGLDSENRKKAAALVRNRAQDKILLFAAHTKEDAALLGAEILCPFDSYCSV